MLSYKKEYKNCESHSGFTNFETNFEKVINSKNWTICQNEFNSCHRILAVGNGGNLAVCDHGAIDIARLTNKSATAQWNTSK